MLNKKNNYLVACSGGPDSMALLDIYFKKGYSLQVGHVNYHKRETAIRDQRIVEDYCKKNNLVFHLLDFDSDSVKGNFQEAARVSRYEWFATLCKENNLYGVLVGHQEDDLLETYLMQIDKKLGVQEYGLASYNELYGVKVFRPLLDLRKEELRKYCDKHSIEYGIDESNLGDDYERNRVRHQKVSQLSIKQREELRIKILESNLEIAKKRNETLHFIYDHNSDFKIDEFLKFPYLETLIRELFDVNFSNAHLKEIIRQLKNNKNYCLQIGNKCLVKEYEHIEFFEIPDDYEYVLSEFEYIDLQFTFKTQKSSKVPLSGVHIDKDEYPITIRNPKPGDKIVLPYGTKKLNRFFIDNKITLRQRLTWPVVLNNKGTAILVPNLAIDKFHYNNPNFFVIKL